MVLEHRLLGFAERVEIGAHPRDRLGDQRRQVAGRLGGGVDLPFEALLPARCEAAQRQARGAEDEARPQRDSPPREATSSRA